MTRGATLRRGGVADARGVVLVEFMIAFGPLLLVFLAAVQLALIGVAELVVCHAAVAGVRAAIVVLDDDPRFYAGEPRGSIGPAPDAPRMAAIRRAVAARMAAIPRGDTVVTLPIAPLASTFFERRVEPSDTLTLRVVHRFGCHVPIASALLCERAEHGRASIRVLHAEATLPAQFATYRYAGEAERGGAR
jgi:hypothetical protein